MFASPPPALNVENVAGVAATRGPRSHATSQPQPAVLIYLLFLYLDLCSIHGGEHYYYYYYLLFRYLLNYYTFTELSLVYEFIGVSSSSYLHVLIIHKLMYTCVLSLVPR